MRPTWTRPGFCHFFHRIAPHPASLRAHALSPTWIVRFPEECSVWASLVWWTRGGRTFGDLHLACKADCSAFFQRIAQLFYRQLRLVISDCVITVCDLRMIRLFLYFSIWSGLFWFVQDEEKFCFSEDFCNLYLLLVCRWNRLCSLSNCLVVLWDSFYRTKSYRFTTVGKKSYVTGMDIFSHC